MIDARRTEVPGTGELRHRLDDRVRVWNVSVKRLIETGSSVLAFGRRDDQPVVLKVIKRSGDERSGDEWRSGEILEAFEGRGVVRVYDHVEGALLLERLNPGHSLSGIAMHKSDDEASSVLAKTIGVMTPRPVAAAVPTVEDWGRGFDGYLASGDPQVPRELIAVADRVYFNLCRSQRHVRLLHGDLHHYNVLLDAERGWLAIDPKGVVGELEYEVGAALRNPYERPDLFTDPAVIRKRVDCFSRELGLDARRIVAWAFAQAVLSAVWLVEDGFPIEADNGSIALALALQPMLDGNAATDN